MKSYTLWFRGADDPEAWRWQTREASDPQTAARAAAEGIAPSGASAECSIVVTQDNAHGIWVFPLTRYEPPPRKPDPHWTV